MVRHTRAIIALESRSLGKEIPMELLVAIDIPCPHCGEIFALQVDTSQAEQSMIEDCAICCRPIMLRVRCRPGEVLSLEEQD
jgi:hypothetical protein